MKIVLILFVIILSFGCNNKSNEKNVDQNNIKENKNTNDFTDSYLKDNNIIRKKMVCDGLEKAIQMSEDIFLTEDGDIYKFSIGKKLYSNNQNCRKIDKSELGDYENKYSKIIAIHYGSYIIDDEFLSYAFSADPNMPNTYYISKQLTPTYNEYEHDAIYFGYKYPIIKIGNNYKYIIGHINDKKIIDIDIPMMEDEEIILISGSLIKTNRRFLIIKEVIKNKDCKKYLDINCEYELIVEESKIPKDYYVKAKIAYLSYIAEDTAYIELKIITKSSVYYSFDYKNSLNVIDSLE